MSLLQKMEDECDCTEVIFQNYIQSRSSQNIFLFFEGKDDYKYYWCRLSLFVDERDSKKYICNCKENVLLIYEMINQKTKKRDGEKLLYFVDKDFEKNNKLTEEIYVTPTYSIENLYVSDKAFRCLLMGEWGLSGEMEEKDKEDFEIAFEYLITKRDEIIESMLYANAWYSLQYNKTKNSDIFPKLSAIKEYHVIKGINDKRKLEELVPNSVEVTDEELQREIDYLKEKSVERLRGKYFEQTMPSYIMKVFEDSNKRSGRQMFSKRRKVNINVGADNMVSVLSNYAEVPCDLMVYITKRLQVGMGV